MNNNRIEHQMEKLGVSIVPVFLGIVLSFSSLSHIISRNLKFGLNLSIAGANIERHQSQDDRP